ncbi:MAG: hypothetical protein EBZ51_09875 [Synechococcaceae bacterium WB9_2_112]|nr:hypothetical protein [Synechococcaceae bacterium WB9_2_112]
MFTINVVDQFGFTGSQQLRIRINGSNDAPLISVAAGSSNTASRTETNTTLTAGGSFSVSDVDLTNTVSAAVVGITPGGTTTGLATGLTTNALVLDGSGDYVEIADSSAIDLTSNFTLEAWFNAAGTGSGGGNGGIILNKEDSYEIARFGDGSIQFALMPPGGGWVWINTGLVAPLNTWSHVALSQNGSSVTVYLNGGTAAGGNQATFTTSSNGNPPIAVRTSDKALRIGGRESRSQDFQGQIADVRVWNTARSASEIAASRFSAVDPASANLIANYRFSGTGSSTANLATGSSRAADGALVGNASRSSQTIAGGNGITDGQLLAMLNLAPTAVLSSTQTTGTLNWSFNSGSEAFDYLASGQQLTLSYTVRVTDSSGLSATQPVSITITGSNDSPVVSQQGTSQAVFKENFDALDGIKNGGQYLTNEPVQYSASIPGWSAAGVHALHVVGRGGAGTSNDALMIYGDNVILSNPISNANTAGQTYAVSFEIAPATYQSADQQTTSGDQLKVLILNASNQIIQSYLVSAGSFSSNPTYRTESFNYIGDGNGDARVRIENQNPSIGRFVGAVDNVEIRQGVNSGSNSNASLAETNTTLTASGSLTVIDPDQTDSVSAVISSVALTGSYISAGSSLPASLVASSYQALKDMLVLTPAAGTSMAADASAGTSLNWTFSSGSNGDRAFNFLGNGQTLTLTYTLTLTDTSSTSGSGAPASTSTPISITITGSNDAPLISITPSAGNSSTASLNETNTSLSASGSLTVSDVDLIDTVTAAKTATVSRGGTSGAISGLTDAELLGMFSVSPATPAVVVDSSNTSGSLSWSFNSGSQSFNELATGEQLTLTYTVRVTDSSGTTADQPITINVSGSNDTPVITATDVSGSITEDLTSGSPARLRDSGSISFSDVDLSDRINTSSSYLGASASSGASVSTALATALQDLANTFTLSGAGVGSLSSANSGTVNWAFSLDDSLSQYLAAGQSITATYRITVSDDSDITTASGNNALSSSSRDVTITINGANDAPQITAPAESSSSVSTFSTSTDGWSSGSLVTSSQWGSFLGAFAVGQSTSKTLSGSTPIQSISFDWLRLDSWDGERFQVYANNLLVFEQQFWGYFASPVSGTTTGTANGYSWSLTAQEAGTNYWGVSNWLDQRFSFTLTPPAGTSSLLWSWALSWSW